MKASTKQYILLVLLSLIMGHFVPLPAIVSAVGSAAVFVSENAGYMLSGVAVLVLAWSALIFGVGRKSGE